MIPIDEDSPTIKFAKTAISQDLENRFTKSNLQDRLLRVSFIDPRFKAMYTLQFMLRQRILPI